MPLEHNLVSVDSTLSEIEEDLTDNNESETSIKDPLNDKDQKKKGKHPKAIIVVHLYGMPAKMKEIMTIAQRYKIPVIEDAAEAIGSSFNLVKAGATGEFSTFSFHGTKTITTGEGGMISTNNVKLNDRCRSLRNLCFGQKGNRFNHDDIGWNYRFTNIQAAFGLGQMKHINWIVKTLSEVAQVEIITNGDTLSSKKIQDLYL